MATVIAEIRLAPGEVGYYDDYSRVYLNSSRPTAKIYAGMNLTQIRRSIRSGRLLLISGSLNTAAPKPAAPVKKEAKPEVPKEKPVEEKPIVEEKPEPEIINEEKTKTEPIETVEPVEEQSTENAEEPAEEAAVKPKRRSRKKQAAE